MENKSNNTVPQEVADEIKDAIWDLKANKITPEKALEIINSKVSLGLMTKEQIINSMYDKTKALSSQPNTVQGEDYVLSSPTPYGVDTKIYSVSQERQVPTDKMEVLKLLFDEMRLGGYSPFDPESNTGQWHWRYDNLNDFVKKNSALINQLFSQPAELKGMDEPDALGLALEEVKKLHLEMALWDYVYENTKSLLTWEAWLESPNGKRCFNKIANLVHIDNLSLSIKGLQGESGDE